MPMLSTLCIMGKFEWRRLGVPLESDSTRKFSSLLGVKERLSNHVKVGTFFLKPERVLCNLTRPGQKSLVIGDEASV